MTEKLTKIIVNCETGEREILELTPEEIAEYEKARADRAELDAKEKADKERIASLKESAKAKLVAGEPLTEEEASVIVL